MHTSNTEYRICSKNTITRNTIDTRVSIIRDYDINNRIFIFYSRANSINNIDFDDMYKRNDFDIYSDISVVSNARLARSAYSTIMLARGARDASIGGHGLSLLI